jgi:hypothetical protein
VTRFSVDFEKDWIFRLSLSTLAMTGEVQRLQEQNGNVVLLNIWATWCGPCQEEKASSASLFAGGFASAVSEISLLTFALAGGWAEAPTCAYALPESFPLFGAHISAALFHVHATAKIGAAGAVPSESAKQNSAQSQKTKRLPESDLAPAEERRQQPVPEMHYQLAADEGK